MVICRVIGGTTIFITHIRGLRPMNLQVEFRLDCNPSRLVHKHESRDLSTFMPLQNLKLLCLASSKALPLQHPRLKSASRGVRKGLWVRFREADFGLQGLGFALKPEPFFWKCRSY